MHRRLHGSTACHAVLL